MHKNYRKTLCKHTNFQKIKKNKNRHNAQKYNNFFVQNSSKQNNKKIITMHKKKDKEKNFFVQKQQISKNFPQNEKSLLTKAHRCDIIVS